MTEEKKEIPGLLKVGLETFIILPFQIAKDSPTGGFNAEDFRETLVKGGIWTRAENIHEPDSLSRVELDECALKRIRYQAYNYFHPFVRRFWYDSNLVQRFRHQKLRTLVTKIKTWSYEVEVSFDASADLYHFLPDIGILVLHLRAKENLPLQHAQDCLDQLRRVYPPYIEGNGLRAGHFPDFVKFLDQGGNVLGSYSNDQITGLVEQTINLTSSSRLSAHKHILASHWAALLAPLGAEGGYKVLQLGDDRASLVSKIDVTPSDIIPMIAQVDRGNMIRLCFADASGRDRMPYSEKYMQAFEQRFCYDRFWYEDHESTDKPSRIMNCGYAFTWLGSSACSGYFTEDANGAPVAFRHIYLPMAIIAHFQKAALLVASRRLADLSPYDEKGQPKLNSKDFELMEAHFIAFTQTYWFDEITPQEQGVELFDMWRRELRLPEMYQQHRQELQDIVAFINGQEEARQTKAATNLNHYAFFFALISIGLAFLGLLTGILGMNELPEKTSELKDITTDAFNWLFLMMPLWKIVLIVSILAVAPYALKHLKAFFIDCKN